MGIVTQVVPDDERDKHVALLIERLCRLPQAAVWLNKAGINRVFETHLDEGLHFERKNFYLTFASEDQKEGMAAFIEKRKPDFKGR